MPSSRAPTTATHEVPTSRPRRPDVAAQAPTARTAPARTATARTATVEIDGTLTPIALAEDGTPTAPLRVADIAVDRAEIQEGQGWLEGMIDAPFVSGTARFEVSGGVVTGRVQVSAGVEVLGSAVAHVGYDGPILAGLPVPDVTVDAGRVRLEVAGRLEEGQLIVEPAVDSGLSIDAAAPPVPPQKADGAEAAAAARTAAPFPDESPGSPLPPALEEKLALLLGAPPEGLLLHTDAAAADAARALAADGFVVGDHLYALPELADPQTPEALDLLGRLVTQALTGISGPVLPAGGLTGPTTEPLAPQPPVDFAAPQPEGEPAPTPVPEPAPLPVERTDAAPGAAEAAGGAGAPVDDEAAAQAEAAAAVVQAATGGEEADEAPEIELLMPAAPAEPPPAQRERLQGVARRAGGRASSARDMPPADTLTTDAREGVTEPPEETMARAEAAVAETLGEREPPSPAIVELCDEIRNAIRAKRPVDEDELVRAEPEQMAQEAGQSLNTAVQGEADQVDTSYQTVNEVTPGAPEQLGQPVPQQDPQVGGPDIAATDAAPDPLPPEDVSLDADKAQLDAQIEQSNINRESSEPITDAPFSAVRDGQDEFGQLAETGPGEVLAEQDAALAEASANMAHLQLQAAQAFQRSRSETVGSVGERQTGMVEDEGVTRESLSRQATEIFDGARTQVGALLDPLTQTAMDKWDRGVGRASTTFKNTLRDVERWIGERHSGVGGFFVSGWDAAFGLPDWVTDSYDAAERKFGDDVCELLLEISADVNTVIALAEGIIADARTRITSLFMQDLPAELQEWAADQLASFDRQLDGLQDSCNQTRNAFEQQVSESAVSTVQEVQQQVEQLREAARGLLGRVMDAIGEFLDDPVRAIINGLLSLVGIPPPAFWALVDKIAQVASDIADDPMNFVNNLIAGIGDGFQLFFDHIGDHLLQGFFDWLFAGLGSVGVQIPSDTSVRSLVTFALQLMGITWPNIREILVRHIGEQNVELIEQAWELITILIEQGPEGIVEMIKERLAPETLFQMVLDAAIDYIVETLIEQAARWLFSLLSPAGWVTKAIELIYQILRWVFENAARIFRFVETIVNGMADIVAGNTGAVAAMVEQALASLIPVVIDFLAGLIGLGDLPDKVVEVIKAIQTRVLAVVESIVAWLVERGRALLASLGLGGEEGEDSGEGGPEDTELGSTERFAAGGEPHRLWVELVGTTATLMIASAPETLEQRLDRWERTATDWEDGEKKAEVQSLLPQVRSHHAQADALADELAPEFAEALSPAPAAEGQEPRDIPSDEPLEEKEEQIAGMLRRLYDLFEETDPESVIQDIATNLPTHAAQFWPDVRNRWMTDQIAKITSTASSSTRVWEDDVLTGAEADGTSLLGQRPTHEALLPFLLPTSQSPPRGANTGVFAHHVFRATAPDPTHGVRDQYRTAVGNASVALLKTKGAAAVTPDVNEELAQHITEIGFVVDAGYYGRFSPFPSLDGVYPHLRAAVTESGGVIHFMRDMVRSGRIGQLTWDAFATIWRNGGRNVSWVKDQFRGVSLGSHEWIPTDMFREVLGFAVDLASPSQQRLDEALDWVTVYNELRSPTNHVIFRIIDEGGALAPTAHVGTFYEPRVGGEYVQRGTAPSKAFHDELRAFWSNNRGLGPAAFVQRLIAHIEQEGLVWDGDLSRVPEELYDEPVGFHYRIGEARYARYTVAQLAEIQRSNFAQIKATFSRVLGML